MSSQVRNNRSDNNNRTRFPSRQEWVPRGAPVIATATDAATAFTGGNFSGSSSVGAGEDSNHSFPQQSRRPRGNNGPRSGHPQQAFNSNPDGAIPAQPNHRPRGNNGPGSANPQPSFNSYPDGAGTAQQNNRRVNNGPGSGNPQSSFNNPDGAGTQQNNRPRGNNNNHNNNNGPRNHMSRPWDQRRDRKKVEPEEKRGNATLDKPKEIGLPQLVQEIQDKLMRGTVECMICYDMVRRSAPIWSCQSCYSIFHLACTKKWARAPTSVDLSAEKNQGLNWRCPGCQSVQLITAKEIRYLCFCGKRQEPPSDLYLTPHSCGEPCGKPLEKHAPGADKSEDDICPHLCVLQCHPGPCPPCKAFAPPRLCPCGKKVITTRCFDRKSVLTCGKRCEKLLDCKRHRCELLCHVGKCDSCEVIVNASCFCKKKSEVLMCGEMAVKGEIKVEEGVFSCNSFCEKKLECGNHSCSNVCHPGPCQECELLPGVVKNCCCGKTSLTEERHSCLDPIPTCSQVCGKSLPCGVHNCKEVCHEGKCAPCKVLVTEKCRCGSTSRTVECHKTTTEEEKFKCDKPCGRKKSCGRHRCSERCCPLSNSRNPLSGDWDPHLCSMPCEKKLRCGQHACQSLCHSGHCPPCLETIFNELTCACGRTSIPPPQPCGTPPPSCQHPCSVPQPCGHPSSHSCHFGDCPPCSIPIAKECVGGHTVLRNIPCGSKDIRCNRLCGKTRQCGMHACARTCHPAPCDSSSGPSTGLKTSCGQTCGAPRRDCRHTCTKLCHPSSPCPDVRCESPVPITCSCGRLTAQVPCDAGGGGGGFSFDTVFEASIIQKLPTPLQPVEANGKKIPLGQRKLMCDDECSKVERKKVLADAFGITANMDALHLGDNSVASEVLSDLYRRDPKWVLSVEERCKFLVLGRSRGGSSSLRLHVFCPMLKDKRDAVRLIAERWKLSVNAAGWEPKRFVVVHVTPKSKAPARVLGAKGSTPLAMLHPPIYDPLTDMDPRLVVALFDLPRDADISALVLRFGGECELVWLNDKNALAVFSDPARAATAMRRLDHGSLYHGAVAVPQNGGVPGSSSGAKDGGAMRGNPWKNAVVQESSWGAEEWSAESASTEPSVWKGKDTPSATLANRWSALESVTNGSSSSASIRIGEPGPGKKTATQLVSDSQPTSSGLNVQRREGVSQDETSEVVDDWEKAFD